MKKTVLIAVLAAVLVFAFASTAMAKVTNAYVSWEDGAQQPAGYENTPHMGYIEGTEKCAVCHAVHNAPVAGTAWTSATADPWSVPVTENTQMLLRSSVANACVYCHITTAIGGKQLYNGNSVLYTAPSTIGAYEENVAHNLNSAKCSNCHSVHGANTFKGAVSAKILKVPTDTTKIQDEILGVGGLYTDLPTAVADNGNRDAQVSVFCSQCHQNYTGASETTINADGDLITKDSSYSAPTGTGGGPMYKSHPMKAVGGEGNNFVAAGSTIPSTTLAAFAGSQYCRSCHDAGGVDSPAGVIDNSFPHYTAGAFNFMLAGSNASGASGLHDKAVDGHCLKCHVSSDDLSGVGKTF